MSRAWARGCVTCCALIARRGTSTWLPSSSVHLPGASVIDAARDVVEGLLPVRGGERTPPYMAEPEGAEPTAEEYNAFFDAIMAMP